MTPTNGQNGVVISDYSTLAGLKTVVAPCDGLGVLISPVQPGPTGPAGASSFGEVRLQAEPVAFTVAEVLRPPAPVKVDYKSSH